MSETKVLWEHDGFAGRIRVLFNEDALAPMVEMKTDGGDWHYIAEGSFSLGAAMVDLLDRLRALESLVRAADSFIENTQSCLASLRKGILEGWELSLLERHEREYLTQRAAVGEIEGD